MPAEDLSTHTPSGSWPDTLIPSSLSANPISPNISKNITAVIAMIFLQAMIKLIANTNLNVSILTGNALVIIFAYILK